MTDYIETRTKDGGVIRIEVDTTAKAAAGFGSRQSTPSNLTHEAVADVYEQVLSTIRGWTNGFVETLQSLETTPTTASLDFAIKIDVETGALIAKSRDDAHLRVSLSWKQAGPKSEED